MDDEPRSPSGSAPNIEQLREARGLTQQQIAKLAGVPRATWANLESGAANPTLAVLHRVAHALQVPLEELIASAARVVPLLPEGHAADAERGAGVSCASSCPTRSRAWRSTGWSSPPARA